MLAVHWSGHPVGTATVHTGVKPNGCVPIWTVRANHT
jgi:hypothetical protein